MTLVSVVIPTKNRASLVKEAVESVLAVQHESFDLEVLVVDDGSTDDTAAAISQYPVTIIHSGGVGASGSRNAGIMAARGDFIAFLDDDDVWLPGNISPQLEAFAVHPEFAAVHGQVILTGADRVPCGGPLPNGPLSSGWIFYDLLHYWPQLASVLVRRHIFAEVGYFDVTLQGDEDWDLLLRIARQYPVGRVEQPVALFCQRRDKEDALQHRRMLDTIRVFRRHTQGQSWLRRLKLEGILLRHRGWYAAIFLTNAQEYARLGDVRGVWRNLKHAVLVSPLHTLMRSWPLLATIPEIVKIPTKRAAIKTSRQNG